MPYLHMQDVSYVYPGGFSAVEHVDLEVEVGDNIAIIGQNGAGKTTLVKMLNGLIQPTEGLVRVGDMTTSSFTTAQISRVVGYVFQNPDDQIFHATVREEVEYGLKKMKLEREQIRERVHMALQLTGMDQYSEENPYNLSFSMRKFITIAAIIAVDCPVLIFDEPTAGQDMSGNRRLAEIIAELRRNGKTLITISHDMEFVANNFDCVVVMANKKILKIGNPNEIFWDHITLEKAMLKQPYISRLCNSLGLDTDIVRLEQGAEFLYKTFAAYGGIKDEM